MNGNALQSIYKKPVWWIGVLVALSIVLASCAPAATPVPTTTPAPTAALVPAAAEAAISVAIDPKYGKILADATGMTLYMYTKDVPDKSNCTAGCLKAWPPSFTSGSPKLGDGVDASMIGSATLADGTKIVTYNHMPLYYFAKDTKPGDITGLGVGGVWFLISPDGKIVGK